jgi:hypothetical protein
MASVNSQPAAVVIDASAAFRGKHQNRVTARQVAIADGTRASGSLRQHPEFLSRKNLIDGCLD